MDDAQWDLIDTMRVSRACSAELEDKIEETLRDARDEQLPKEFDIRDADFEVQSTLAAYIKRLCLRRQTADDAWEYFHAMQERLNSRPKDGTARSIYRHPANRVDQIETMSVSVEQDRLSAVPERRGPVRRVRRQRRGGKIS